MTLLADSTDLFNWTLLLPIVAGSLAVWYMLPTPKRRPLSYGLLASVVALAGLGAFLIRGLGERIPETVEAVLFFGFSGLAIAFAVLMITGRNPARCALAFAMVILSTCGLFLLLAAPFLMAATIVIYAGAIIVTFLFVIMLSQQSGLSNADLRSREPELSVAAGFVLMSMFLVGLQRVYDWRTVDAAIEHANALATADTVDPSYFPQRKPGDDGMNFQPVPLTPKAEAFVGEMRAALERVKIGASRSKDDRRLTEHKSVRDVQNAIEELFKDPDSVREDCRTIADGLTRLKFLRSGSVEFDDVVRSENGEVKPLAGGLNQLPAANVSAIGRTLFSDHLLAVELAGTLLLVATIGAIAIAGRRERTHA